MTSPIVEAAQHYVDLIGFADASLRLVPEEDEVTRAELLALKEYASARMREIWAGVELECASREVGREKAAVIQRAGCNGLIELFGKAYRREHVKEKVEG